MSYPYPQDRHRDRKEKGDQPYEDDRDAFAEKQAKIERNAPLEHDQADDRVTDEDQAHDAEERFEQIGDDVARERDGGDGS